MEQADVREGEALRQGEQVWEEGVASTLLQMGEANSMVASRQPLISRGWSTKAICLFRDSLPYILGLRAKKGLLATVGEESFQYPIRSCG